MTVTLTSVDAVATDLLPAEPLVVLAFVLLVGGIVASVTPVVPGGLLSLAGVYTYWWETGEPGIAMLAGLSLLAGLALAADWFAGLISAKVGGASTRTTVIATVAGVAGLVAAGPIGFLLGTAGTVLGMELSRNGDTAHSFRTAGVTLLGMLAASVFQVIVTAGVLLLMVGVAAL